MNKKLDRLRNVFDKLRARYGDQDEDVRQLQVELDLLEVIAAETEVETQASTPDKYNFQSLAKQRYDASRQDSLH